MPKYKQYKKKYEDAEIENNNLLDQINNKDDKIKELEEKIVSLNTSISNQTISNLQKQVILYDKLVNALESKTNNYYNNYSLPAVNNGAVSSSSTFTTISGGCLMYICTYKLPGREK